MVATGSEKHALPRGELPLTLHGFETLTPWEVFATQPRCLVPRRTATSCGRGSLPAAALHRETEGRVAVLPPGEMRAGPGGSLLLSLRFSDLPSYAFSASGASILSFSPLFSGSVSIVFHRLGHTAKPHSLHSRKTAVVILRSSGQRNMHRGMSAPSPSGPSKCSAWFTCPRPGAGEQEAWDGGTIGWRGPGSGTSKQRREPG